MKWNLFKIELIYKTIKINKCHILPNSIVQNLIINKHITKYLLTDLNLLSLMKYNYQTINKLT
jgi:hypothetical protein